MNDLLKSKFYPGNNPAQTTPQIRLNGIAQIEISQ